MSHHSGGSRDPNRRGSTSSALNAMASNAERQNGGSTVTTVGSLYVESVSKNSLMVLIFANISSKVMISTSFELPRMYSNDLR